MAKYLNFFEDNDNFEETQTVGGIGTYTDANKSDDFDTIFENACDNFQRTWKTSWRNAVTNAEHLENPAKMASFKEDLLSGLRNDVAMFESFSERSDNPDGLDAGSPLTWYDKVSKLYDNKVNELITESASVGQLMPIKTIDFPLLVKANVQQSFGDIIKEEITPTLEVKKRIERTIAYNKKNPDQTWEVPQCWYDDSFIDMMKAGSGTSLNSQKAITLPAFNKNLITELTDLATYNANTTRIVMDIMIDRVLPIGATDPVVLKTPIKVDLATNTWVGGVINQKYTVTTTPAGGGDPVTEEKTLVDVVTGTIDWIKNTVTLSNANTTTGVAAVYFRGKLSNEGNENTIRTRYVQEDKTWFIGEKTKVDASYTLEELQEHKAMLNMDLYKKSYNDLVNLLSQMEDSQGYEWLDEEFRRYDGQQFDALGWDPMVMKTNFDCDSTIATVALQSEYIAKELKFKIDRFLIDIADTVKLDNMHFVIWGNPRYISLLDPFVKWVFRTGDSVGGVKLDYSYGVMTSGSVKVYVVASKKVNAIKHQTLRILPFVDSNETITFKRFKFGTNVVTSKESAYKDTERVGGSMTYVWGTSRYEDVSLQAMQMEIGFENADFITLIDPKTAKYRNVAPATIPAP